MTDFSSGLKNVQNRNRVGRALQSDRQPNSRSWWPAEVSFQTVSSKSSLTLLSGPTATCTTDSAGITGHHVPELRGDELAEMLGLLTTKTATTSPCEEVPGNTTKALSGSAGNDTGTTSLHIADGCLYDCSAATPVARQAVASMGFAASTPSTRRGLADGTSMFPDDLCSPGTEGSAMNTRQSPYAEVETIRQPSSFIADLANRAVEVSGTSNLAQPPSFTPDPAWPMQAASLLYVAVFLTTESREVLLSLVPPQHACVQADHMTLAFRPSVVQLLEYPIGAEVQLHVLGGVVDDRVQAAVADPPTWLPPTRSSSTHITISLVVGARAVEAGELVVRAMHGNESANTSAELYKPLLEPLPIVGRLGVMVKAQGTARLNTDGIVLYSVDELEQHGYLSLGVGNLRLFHQKHYSAFHRQQVHASTATDGILKGGWKPFNVQEPSGTRSLGAMTTLPMAGHGLDPAAVALSSQSSGTNMQLQAHTSCVHSNDVGEGFDLVLSSKQTPCLAMGSEHKEPTMHLVCVDANDTSCSNEVVQFKSAVHIGDYVVVQPFVFGMGKGGKMHGYVKEFANDESFQGDGVLVVLTNNTIGYVIAVEPRPTQECMLVASATSDDTMNTCSFQTTDQTSCGNVVLEEGGVSVQGGVLVGDSSKGIADVQSGHEDDDLQSWSEFEELQNRYGESVCYAILSSCGADVKHAISLIKAQADSLPLDAPMNGGGSNWRESGGASTDGLVFELQEDTLLHQLATSLDLDPRDAKQLCRLAPHVPSLQVLDIFQRCEGDVHKAANILLTANDGVGEDVEVIASKPMTGLWTLSHGAMVARVGHLCSMYPHLCQDTARLLLLEHGGDLNKVLEVLSDMQAYELQAQSAAADGAIKSSSQQLAWVSEEDQMAILNALGLLKKQCEQGAGDATMTTSAYAQQSAHPALAAQGRPTTSADAAKVAQGRPRTAEHVTMAAHARAQRPTTAPVHCQHLNGSVVVDESDATIRQSQDVGDASVAGPSQSPQPACRSGHVDGDETREQLALPLPSTPPPPAKQGDISVRSVYQQPYQEQPLDPDFVRTRDAVAEVVDKLYKRSKELIRASKIYMTAAQARLSVGDTAAYRAKKEAAYKAQSEGRALFEEANRLSWSANNPQQQAWRIDLHGQGTTRAMKKFAQQLDVMLHLDSPGGIRFLVITGKGNHSDDSVGKIKLNVLKYLEERATQVKAQSGSPWRVTWQIDPSNEGCIVINIPGRQ